MRIFFRFLGNFAGYFCLSLMILAAGMIVVHYTKELFNLSQAGVNLVFFGMIVLGVLGAIAEQIK